MGTIVPRKKKDGAVSYTAQIRIRRKGEIVYQESQTFVRRSFAVAWLKKRESELAEPGALARAGRKAVTVGDAINHYLEEMGSIQKVGRTKHDTLKALANSWLGELLDTELTSQKLVEYAHWRRSTAGGAVKPQTVGNDFSHLGAVMSIAKTAWGYELDPHQLTAARTVLRRMGLVSRSVERDRRPTLDELDALLAHYSEMQKRRPTSVNMLKVVGFAIFSTRRQAEITRITWDDYDKEGKRVLVRDMKNPGQKIGNNVWCALPDEAVAILESMPKHRDRIFPYDSDTVSNSFTKACKFLGIEDLTFHDLRHEGVSRLFEMDWDIPRVASVSAHRDWNSMRRYTHLRGRGDKYAGWAWLPKIIKSRVVLRKGPEKPSRR